MMKTKSDSYFYWCLTAGKRHRVAVLGAACLMMGMSGNAARADSVIFSDKFPGQSLNPAWQTLAGQGAYSVDNGLQYYNQGPLSSPTGWSTTSLSLGLPFSGTNWEADVKATYSLDWCTSGSFTGPSVPDQSCSSGAQQGEVGVSFAPVTASDRSALQGDTFAYFERGTDAWYGSDQLSANYGNANVSDLLIPADDSINNNIAGGTYWYQFIRNGQALTMKVSSDGVNYVTALSETLPNSLGASNELILTGETYLTVGSFTDYSFVNITATGAAPEPSTWGLLVAGLLALPLARWRRDRASSARG
jgi:hypothetical protein